MSSSGTRERNRTATASLPQDFKSCVSTSSTTQAGKKESGSKQRQKIKDRLLLTAADSFLKEPMTGLQPPLCSG